MLFNDGWQFALDYPESFEPVRLPHDWLITDTKNLYKNGIGWYKRELDAGIIKAGQRLIIHFDGVYMDCSLFVNDTPVGEWKYGYTAFEFDITDYLKPDSSNVLLVKVVYQSPNARWYTGAGIYRDVHVFVKNSCHFVTDGIYISTFKNNGAWDFNVTAEVESGGCQYEEKHYILNNVKPYIPWDIENPVLYTLHSELFVSGELVDTADTNFGFREIEFTVDKGFFLNGRHLKLNGVCLHHDLGALGAAVYPDAIVRQLNILKNMGVNAVRTAHNPSAKVFMELADKMGFLVMSEILDIWERPKCAYDYSRFFNEWIKRDVASWIKRDRNHPSVIMWSIGNEIYDTHADAETGGNTVRRLTELVKLYDPCGHAPVTLCSNYLPWENTQKCADIVKLVGYNYAEHLYSDHHIKYPDWIIYGSETCSTVQSRGIYHFPLEKSILADDDLQCSALGNSATSWGAKSVEACIIADRDTAFSLGQFLWAGQDYLGEPTPYHTKNSYLGHIDTAGFPKDSYFIFKAAWTNCEKTPFVHVFPYWDFSAGQMIDVRICSNLPEVELFLNGVGCGRQTIFGKYVANYRLKFVPGTLRAVAYDKDGKIAAEQFRHSFGDAVCLRQKHETFGRLTFVTVTAEDEFGRVVENANCRVRVSVEHGTLLGLDNGDATDYDQYQTDNKRLFAGKLLAIVEQGNQEPVIKTEIDNSDIPVRKIELKLESDGFTVTAKTFPENADINELFWRVTDIGGIDSPLASIDAKGRTAVVLPKGDGIVYIRCAVKNGREHISIISQLQMTISGYGKPFLNPYGFISGGLYNACNVALTNGNERGVATLRDSMSHVGFRDVDFGSFGSDEVTLMLFPLSKDPFSFEIWEGMPQEDGALIYEAYYDKGSVWNTYQEVTYKLPRRLTGITTVCFVFRQKVHIKGFSFTKLNKAFLKHSITKNDAVYGDSFTVKADTIENIGNNVTIIFKDMDFGESPAKTLCLCWRSKQAKNSMQIVFSDESCKDTETRKMIELPASEDYTFRDFSLGEGIRGEKTVSFVFLPGCNIDIAWFQFK